MRLLQSPALPLGYPAADQIELNSAITVRKFSFPDRAPNSASWTSLLIALLLSSVRHATFEDIFRE